MGWMAVRPLPSGVRINFSKLSRFGGGFSDLGSNRSKIFPPCAKLSGLSRLQLDATAVKSGELQPRAPPPRADGGNPEPVEARARHENKGPLPPSPPRSNRAPRHHENQLNRIRLAPPPRVRRAGLSQRGPGRGTPTDAM